MRNPRRQFRLYLGMWGQSPRWSLEEQRYIGPCHSTQHRLLVRGLSANAANLQVLMPLLLGTLLKMPGCRWVKEIVNPTGDGSSGLQEEERLLFMEGLDSSLTTALRVLLSNRRVPLPLPSSWQQLPRRPHQLSACQRHPTPRLRKGLPGKRHLCSLCHAWGGREAGRVRNGPHSARGA